MRERSKTKSPFTAKKFGADPVDVHIGHRLRARRTLLGISQEELAQRLGVTFQQVQKYEHGRNRISGSRLFDAACALHVPVGYFFEDMSEDVVTERVKRAQLLAAEGGTYVPPERAVPERLEDEPMRSTQAVELVGVFNRLTDEQRVSALEFLRTVAKKY